jgi:hypothetical protein
MAARCRSAADVYRIKGGPAGSEMLQQGRCKGSAGRSRSVWLILSHRDGASDHVRGYHDVEVPDFPCIDDFASSGNARVGANCDASRWTG